MAVLALGFTACNDETTATPQFNPQEQVMEADGVAVAIPEATATSVNFNNFVSEPGLVPVLDVTKIENFPAYYELKGVMQYSKDANFATYKEVNLVTEGTSLFAPTEAWEDAHLALYSKNPRETTSYVRFLLYGVNGTSAVRLGGEGGVYFAAHELKVTPLEAKVPIEDSYYIIVDGVESQMNATNPDDVYAPPTFSLAVDVPADGVTFTIKSKSGKVYGQAGDKEDGLALNGQAIKITDQGPHLVIVNMEEMTYTVTLALAQIYAGAATNSAYELATTDYVNYRGFVGLRGTSMRMFDKTSGTTMYWCQAYDGEDPIPGQLALVTKLEDVKNLVADVKGCQWVTANLSALTYSITHIDFWGITGSINGWNEKEPMMMTTSDRFSMIWTIKDVNLADGDEFKFTTNGSWDINIGCAVAGDDSALAEHGENIVWSHGTGTFDITLDLSKVPYTMTYTKK